MFLFCILYLLCMFEACSPQVLDVPVFVRESALIPRIVNGYPAALGDVPYQVGFKKLKSRIRRTYYTFCGGAIIGPKMMLSAAHCFKTAKSGCCAGSIVQEGKEVSSKFAVAGTLLNVEPYRPKSTGTAQWRRLSKVVFPAAYRFPQNDFAVVMTSQAFIFNANVVRIPYATRFVDYRGECLMSGYGRTSSSHKKKETSEILLHARLELLPTFYCNRLHRRNMRKFICTSSKVSDTGKGDSGGPLVCSRTGQKNEGSFGVLVGVLNGKRYIGRKGSTFFARVSSYSRFVATNEANSNNFCIFNSCFVLLLRLVIVLF